MITSPQWTALDEFELILQSDGAPAAINRLVSQLSEIRATLPIQLWREWCLAASSHGAIELLNQDPYTRDARLKPAGYAGDARTLDYVYLRAVGSQSLTPLGRSLFDITTGVPVAEAVRLRSVVVAQQLEGLLRNGRSVSATSIACGHARELDLLPPERLKGLHFWGLDQDEASIIACRSRFGAANFSFEVGSVVDLVRGRPRLPDSDFVYAAGLFDYLDERIAAALLRRMFSALKIGGRLVVANLTAANDEIAYMEAVMDWWMYYRDQDTIRDLGTKARIDALKSRVSTYTTSGGRVAWLEVERVG